MTQATNSITVTIPNPTTAQMNTIAGLLASMGEAAETAPKKRASRAKPAKTVSDEEDEDFGKKAMTSKDVEDEDNADDEEESETESEEEDDEDGEEEEPGVTFDEVKAAMNKYGEKFPDQMRAILLAHNLKSPKELKNHPKYWEPVYRKTMAKIKTMKKK